MTGAAVRGRAGLLACTVSVALVVLTGLLGPSAVQRVYPPPGPARYLPVEPSDALVTGLLAAALLVGAAGVLLAWWALRGGWRPSPRRLLVAGLVAAAAVTLVPPMGSTDLGLYAGYGRLAVLGLSPYSHDVDELVLMGEPDGPAYQGAWTETSSVYGPVAVAAFWLSAEVAGTSARTSVWLLQLLALVAFAVVAVLLDRAARAPDAAVSDRARARVALLWTLNPLLLFELVNAAHVDTLAVALGLAALLVVSRSAVGAGVLVALAAAVKISYGLYAVSLAWALRRRPRTLARYLAAGVVTGMALFLPVWPEVVDPLQLASRSIASESPWHVVDVVLRDRVTPHTLRTVVGLGAAVLLVVVVRRLDLGLPAGSGDARGRAVRTAALLGAGWLLTAAYALPWYDAIAWAPLVLLPASGVDLVLLARLTMVSVAYLPGAADLAGGAGEVRSVVHGFLAPAVCVSLVVVVLVAGPRLSLGATRRPATTP